MRMIPYIPYKTPSKAEKIVFDKLRETYPSNNNYISLHSLNLTNHAYKRFGEIDFLIVCPLGIYVIEVKGGQVNCHKGVWEFTNRYGERNTKREGPFKQAESALHSVKNKMRTNLSTQVMNEISIGYGVVLPDCKLPVGGSEWDQQVLCDGGSHRDIEGWLKRLFRYWRKKDHKQRTLSTESLQKIVNFLRPDFEAIIPLHSYSSAASDEINRLTASQMKFIDVIEANHRVLCQGGAGTGKTFLAIELARRWTAEGLKVALVCNSSWLKNYLQENHVTPNLTISTVQGLRQSLRREGLDRFDALIVDEGQDLLTLAALEILNNAIKEELKSGMWCFFMDINNQSGFFDEIEKEAIDFLNSLKPVNIPLHSNCRNTNVILNKIKADTRADVGVKGAGYGPEVREINSVRLEDLASKIEKEMDALTNDGGLLYQQITILSDDNLISVLIPLLSPKTRSKLSILDEYSIRSFPPDKISISSVADFKGLENDAIIFISPSKNLIKNKNLSYVAMSRAKSVLTIICMTDL